ncbi:MAG: dienelactone hydrolase [Alphaproteobacteria bacterium]|nr:dienelactone hydrolase [Alphaproteobacteria bacterium]
MPVRRRARAPPPGRVQSSAPRRRPARARRIVGPAMKISSNARPPRTALVRHAMGLIAALVAGLVLAFVRAPGVLVIQPARALAASLPMIGLVAAARRLANVLRVARARVLLGIFGLVPAAVAQDLSAGFQRMTVFADGDAQPAPVALFYPTRAPDRAVAMGPFTARVAMNGPAEPGVKALIVLSHGTGGSELGHSGLAAALARNGYLVAALRHGGDNWQDRSLLRRANGGYFVERPRQASRVIDAVVASAEWRDRIARDDRGPKVGAIGHSAGGYTVLALAGGRPDPALVISHCATSRAEDPVFCGVAASAGGDAPAAATPASAVELRDPRVRAVVALAPVGVVLAAESLAAIVVPTMVVVAEKDSFLVPRFHGLRLEPLAPQLRVERVAGAGHFAFMDRPGAPVPTEDGDAGADPPGFDRASYLRELQRVVLAFLDDAIR